MSALGIKCEKCAKKVCLNSIFGYCTMKFNLELNDFEKLNLSVKKTNSTKSLEVGYENIIYSVIINHHTRPAGDILLHLS